MTEYEIFSDMSIDMDAEAAACYDIRFIPMELTLGDERSVIEKMPTLEEMHVYYDHLRMKTPTGTSQVTPFEFEEIFAPYLEKDIGVLYISLSSGLSNTYQSALLAVENLKDRFGEDRVHIEVVDSLGATCGQGILAEAAGMNREDGLSLSDNAAWLRKYALNVHYWFRVEDLFYLMRGGRVSGATAVIGTALNIKPVLTILANGRLDTIAKKRGSRLALKFLSELYAENRESGIFEDASPMSPERTEHLKELNNRVYVLSTDSPAETAELSKLALEINPEAKISVTSVSPVIGAHTGPDMLAIVFFGRKRS